MLKFPKSRDEFVIMGNILPVNLESFHFFGKTPPEMKMIFGEMRIRLLKGKTGACGNLLSFAFICKVDIVATTGFTLLSIQNIASV